MWIASVWKRRREALLAARSVRSTNRDINRLAGLVASRDDTISLLRRELSDYRKEREAEVEQKEHQIVILQRELEAAKLSIELMVATHKADVNRRVAEAAIPLAQAKQANRIIEMES